MEKRTFPALVIGALILLSGCSGSDDAGTQQSIKVKTSVIKTTESSMSQAYSATIEEENGTALSFSVGGTIVKLVVNEGQSVSKGQLIATLDDTSLSNSYTSAKAGLDQAKDAYNRMKQLHDAGSLAEIKWIETETQLSQAEAAYEIARKNLNDTKLYAPYSGVISEKAAEVGQNVNAGTTVVKIVTARQLDAKIAVPETEIASMTIGQAADITVQALGGRTFRGAVREKGVVANASSRSYDVKIRVQDAPADLLPGMVASVVMENSGKAGDGEDKAISASGGTIVIAADIVQLADDNRNFLWVVEDGKASRRFITIGEYTANGVTVVDGLASGDVVIVEGQQKVCDGTAVEI